MEEFDGKNKIRTSFRDNRKWYHMTILNCLKKTYFIFFVLIVPGHFLKSNLINELNTRKTTEKRLYHDTSLSY